MTISPGAKKTFPEGDLYNNTGMTENEDLWKSRSKEDQKTLRKVLPKQIFKIYILKTQFHFIIRMILRLGTLWVYQMNARHFFW